MTLERWTIDMCVHLHLHLVHLDENPAVDRQCPGQFTDPQPPDLSLDPSFVTFTS